MLGSSRLRSLAEQKLAVGDLQECRTTYHQIIDAGDGTSVDHFNLAYVLRIERRYAEALEQYGQAVRLGIAKPEEALLNMAAIHSERLNDDVSAKACLDEALSLNPRFLPARLNLGQMLEDLGQIAEARAAYSEALAVEPSCGRALARLAILDIFEGDASNRLEEIQSLIDQPGTVLKDAIELGFAEGQILDSLGKYDSAFAAFVRANEYVDEESCDLPPYDPAYQERFVKDMARIAPSLAVGAIEPEDSAPIFICGMFRSGSTLLESLLARHSQMSAGGELEAIPSMVAQQLLPYPESLAKLGKSDIDALRAQYLSESAIVAETGKIVIDKRPDNFQHIGLIKMLFPHAKILHTRRHYLDNIISIYFGNFDQSIRYGTDLQNAMHWYDQYQTLMKLWQSCFGNDIHDVSYEALVTDSETTMRAALEFCGLPWEEVCSQSGAIKAPVKTLSNWQVRQPIHARSAGRWRNYETHLSERLMLPGQRHKK